MTRIEIKSLKVAVVVSVIFVTTIVIKTNRVGEPKLVSGALESNSCVYRVDVNNNGTNIPLTIKEAIEKFKELITNHPSSGIKFYFSLSMVFQKFTDASQLTDPPVVFRSPVYVSLAGSDLASDAADAYEHITKQIDEYQNNGSGWVINQIKYLDLGKKLTILIILLFC